MSIFNNYPKVNYKIDDYDFLTAIDITNNFKIRNIFKTYRGISYEPYVIQDGERPDLVSQKLYGTPNFDWIILFVNDIYSIYDEWPRDREALKTYIIEKYGSLSTAQSTIKFYYDVNKNIIDLTTYNSLAPSQRSLENAYEYEIRLNTQKSIIKTVTLSVAKRIETDLRSVNIKPVI
jgi:hypothetical protein